MAKDNNRISINKFEQALRKDNIVMKALENTEDVEISIKRTISLQEMVLFVKEVVEACVDGETGEYLPEAYDFAIRVAVLTHYANFAMPSSIEKQYLLAYNTSAFNQVLNVINMRQFEDIVRSIDKKIQYMLDVMSSAAVSKIHEVIDKFNEIAETGEKVFGSASADDMAAFIGGVSKLNDMKEEDIAKAIIDIKDGTKVVD